MSGPSPSLARAAPAQELPTGRIVIVIPAYNEADSIADVVAAIPPRVCDVLTLALVVDDGSADATVQRAEAAGALVLRHETNRGGGAALRTGYEHAAAADARVIVTLDADGQHLPAEVGRLVEPVLAGRADFVVGSRALGQSQGGVATRRLGIWVFNALISLLTRQRVTDCSNGYRAMRPAVLQRLDLRQDQFHAAEFLIEALTRGVRTVEVPVTVLERSYGKSKKPATLRYGWGFLNAIVQAWLRARRRGRTSPRIDHTRVPAEAPAGERPSG